MKDINEDDLDNENSGDRGNQNCARRLHAVGIEGVIELLDIRTNELKKSLKNTCKLHVTNDITERCVTLIEGKRGGKNILASDCS